MAYPADTTHLNRPEGLYIDGSNNLFVAEQTGKRILKFDATGIFEFSIGTAGLSYIDNYVFNNVNDLVTDGSGNIWAIDEPRVIEYDATGQFTQQFPATNPWEGGDANDRFNGPRGIALDEANHLLFVSDTWNHRIQVYDISSGSPVYSATIGQTGNPGSANDHLNTPYRIAVDGNHNLYIADRGNNRVQKCAFTTAWICTTLTDLLSQPEGLTVDSSNNVYIADTQNSRIVKCLSGGSCSVLARDTYWLSDLAVDSNGSVYGSTNWEELVARYDSSGTLVQDPYLGVKEVPYLSDTSHFNRPRVAIDANDNILVLEEAGQRLTKLNALGSVLWSVGYPGQDFGGDNKSLNWPAGVATDKNSNIYVADSFRIQIFSPAGAYLDTIPGSGSNRAVPFSHLNGIAIDPNNGIIYVSDNNDQVVYVFNGSRQYVTTLGMKGTPGSGYYQFNSPSGLTVDKNGNLYVADQNNCRVQKFNSSLILQYTFGSCSNSGNGFASLSGDQGITVDAQGNVFIADTWNNRVEVFNREGAYLTTIGGSWGNLSSQFRDNVSVAVDSKGNVYVGDAANHRIQVFAPGVSGWVQSNLNGFGTPDRQVAVLNEFNGKLYAGVSSWSNPPQIWQTADGKNWSDVTPYGSTINAVPADILTMANFNSQMYAGTGWSDANTDTIWRTANGTDWTPVVTDDFGGSGTERNVDVLTVFKNQIYAAVSSESSTTGVGVSIYRSSTGNPGTWSAVVTGGNGDIRNTLIDSLVEFNGALYASGKNPDQGAFIWKSTDGSAWNQVGAYGLDASHQDEATSMAVFNGKLFLGTYHNAPGLPGQVWSSPDGTTWSPVITDGFGDANNNAVMALYTYGNALYAVTDNGLTGSQVLKSLDGIHWTMLAPSGFGDSNNTWVLRGHAITGFKNALFVAMVNDASGVEVWQMLRTMYLPLIRR